MTYVVSCLFLFTFVCCYVLFACGLLAITPLTANCLLPLLLITACLSQPSSRSGSVDEGDHNNNRRTGVSSTAATAGGVLEIVEEDVELVEDDETEEGSSDKAKAKAKGGRKKKEKVMSPIGHGLL